MREGDLETTIPFIKLRVKHPRTTMVTSYLSFPGTKGVHRIWNFRVLKPV